MSLLLLSTTLGFKSRLWPLLIVDLEFSLGIILGRSVLLRHVVDIQEEVVLQGHIDRRGCLFPLTSARFLILTELPNLVEQVLLGLGLASLLIACHWLLILLE